MKITRFAAALALVLFLVAPAAAQYDNVKDRGFNADIAYQLGEFDAVNTLNGNLTLTIPLGPVYKTNGPLEYSFKAVYNSQFWDHWQHSAGHLTTDRYRVASSGGAYLHSWTQMMVMFHEYDWVDGQTVTEASGIESYPTAIANAGLGWIVTLGELENGSTYISPDGNRHQFFKFSHGASATTGSPGDLPGPFYTRDGSFLRMRKAPDEPLTGAKRRIVDFPNGVQKRFKCTPVAGRNDCNNWEGSEWLLDQITDTAGNIVWITRSQAQRPAPGYTWTWTIREGSNASGEGYADYLLNNVQETRSHTLAFVVDGLPRGCSGASCSRWTQLRLTSVSVSAIGGTNADYQFTYEAGDIYRDHGSFWNQTQPDGVRAPFNGRGKVDVQYLKQIELPRVSGPNKTSSSGSWSFTYERQAECTPDTAPCSDPDLILRVLADGYRFLTGSKDGFLNQVTAPAGAVVDYEYEPRTIPERSAATHPVRSPWPHPCARWRRKRSARRTSTPLLLYGVTSGITTRSSSSSADRAVCRPSSRRRWRIRRTSSP